MTETDPPGQQGSPSRLQEEIRQSRPFRSKGQEAFLSLLRSADLAKHRFSHLSSVHRVTFQQ